MAGKSQSLGCGGGIVRDELLLQKIRAPQGVKPLREPLLQLLGLSHRPLFGADHIRRVSWGQQIQHHDGAGHSAAQLAGARARAEAAAQGQALRLRQSDHILKSRQNALAAVEAFLVVTNRLFTPIHSLFSLSFFKSYYSDRSLDSSSSFRSR